MTRLHLPILAALALGGLATAPVRAAPPTLTATVGPTGLTDLRYGSTDLLKNGDLRVEQAFLVDADGKEVAAAATPTATEFDPSRRRVRRMYDWGTVTCAYAVRPDRVDVTIEIRNTSRQTLSRILVQALSVKFAGPPRGWQPNYPYFGVDRGDPTVELADFGEGTLAVCDEAVDQPLLVGFPGRADFGDRPIEVGTSNFGFLAPYLNPYIKRPIPPGGSETFRLSLRFGAPGATEPQIAGDLYRKLAATYPSRLDWTDRRPIGTLHLAVSETQYHSPTNPRGWFADPKLDVTTEAGRAAFKARVLKYADDSVVELKRMKAQGMITWDLEGEEYPQATTYIGDPRLLGELDPEMDLIADDYFRKFRDAGLRTGLCIRPERLLRSGPKAEQVELAGPAEVTQLLFDKMVYANRRWGCTLFYVDSNGDPNVPFDPAIFENLVDRLKHERIKALVIPEHRNTRYYDCTAPYTELRLGVIGTPERVRAAYPKAFLANYVADGPIAKQHDALVAAAKSGDILMFRGWWADPQNAEVQRIYDEAQP